jgi:hypothetical protein
MTVSCLRRRGALIETFGRVILTCMAIHMASAVGGYALKDPSFYCIYVGVDARGEVRYVYSRKSKYWPDACPAAKLQCDRMHLHDCRHYGLFRG